MERRLIEEMTTMKGGQGRLEKIYEEYRALRALTLTRVQEIDDLMILIRDCLDDATKKKLDSAAE